jgi:thiamine biosynthesis lipoprotein
MNRRDFLHPNHLIRTAGQAYGTIQDLGAANVESPADEAVLLRASRRAMATQFEVLLPFGTPQAVDIAEAALDEIDRLEEQLTVYRETSEISAINRLAGTRPIVVEPRLFDLLRQSAQITRTTGGAFDITAGALIKAWGFFRRQGRVPTDEERAAALSRVGMQHVALNAENCTIHFQKPGLEINLGSIGKGYALDRVAELLRERWNVKAALLHGGHSSVYAIGGEPGSRRGWPVGIQHPEDPERRLAVVRLKNQALGTSSATFQHLEYNGRKLGHLLNPRTGWPAEGIASASVVAPTAAEADALATAFFVQGVEAARTYCETHPGIGAILLPSAAESPVVFGLSPDALELTPNRPKTVTPMDKRP